jgi:hypothetical protein
VPWLVTSGGQFLAPDLRSPATADAVARQGVAVVLLRFGRGSSRGRQGPNYISVTSGSLNGWVCHGLDSLAGCFETQMQFKDNNDTLKVRRP